MTERMNVISSQRHHRVQENNSLVLEVIVVSYEYFGFCSSVRKPTNNWFSL